MSVNGILTGQQKSYTKAEEDALLATKQNTLTFVKAKNLRRFGDLQINHFVQKLNGLGLMIIMHLFFP